jgi:hypothetical protein
MSGDTMRFFYFPLMAALLWSYWRALKCAREERTPFTPLLGWLIGLGYFVVAPLTLVVLNGGYQIPDFYGANARYASVNLSDVRYAVPVLLIWLSLFLAFQVVALLQPLKKQAWRACDLSVRDQKLKRVIFLTLGISILDCLFTIWRSGGLESFLITHWYLRQEESFAALGDVFVLYAQFSLANQMVFTAAAALFTARKLQMRNWEWKFGGLIGLGLILEMIMSGNRIFIALYGLSFLTACWAYGRKKLVGVILLLSPLVFLFFSAWAYFRHDLSAISDDLPGYVDSSSDMQSPVMTTLMNTTEGTNVLQLLHMVNDFGNQFNYFYGLTYSKAVTFILPRAWYPGKPENYPVQIARLYEPGEVTSLSTTQLGELYANFGVLVVPLLPLFTILILLGSAKLAERFAHHALLLAVLFLQCISFARSSFEDNFISLIFAVLLMQGFRLEQGLLGFGNERRAPQGARPSNPPWIQI